MKDLIVIGGSPGSGKSTVCNILKNYSGLENAVWIPIGRLREFHSDWDWKMESEVEEQVAFENLILIVRNYWKHGYNPIILE